MSTWRPDLLSLRLFVAVCEEASIARAAERESIVPSAISKRIAEIEESIGMPLLLRGPRGVRPTPAGTAFLHHARQMTRSSNQLQAEMAEYAKGVRGHVRLLANISSISKSLPRDLATFLARHGQVRVDLQERVSAQIVDGVRDGSAELGVCLATADTSDLHCVPYDTDRLTLVAHPAHPLARLPSVVFAQMLEHEFVALSQESGTTRLLTGLAARMGRTLNHRIYVSSFTAACQIIAENLAIGVLAVDAVQHLTGPLGLATVPIADDWATREVVMCVRDPEGLQPPARALMEHLGARAGCRGGSGSG